MTNEVFKTGQVLKKKFKNIFFTFRPLVNRGHLTNGFSTMRYLRTLF
jgi:hypothetical protein